MSIKDLTVPELDLYRRLCNFTTDEMEYFNLKADEISNERVAYEMRVATSTVSNISKRVRNKIERVRYFIDNDLLSDIN